MTPERALKEKLMQYCKKNNLEARKIHYEGRAGCPDWLIFGKQKHIFLEIKAPGKFPSKQQFLEFCKLEESGIKIFIADNIEIIKEILDKEFTLC